MILVNFSVLQFSFALLLKSNDDQSNENVDKEKGKDDEEDNVKNGHLNAEQGNGTFVFKRGSHRMLEHPATNSDILGQAL